MRKYLDPLPITLGILILFIGIHWSPSSLAEVSQTSDSGICPAQLATEIEEIIEEDKFKRSRWGIFIKTLDSNQKLYDLDSDKYFIPASNVKLLTTAAALLQFGSPNRIRTPVYLTGTPPHLSSLRIVGRGDPSLTTDDLKTLTKQLKERGIKQIESLIVEDTHLPTINPTWEWEDVHFAYATAVNQLILNENEVTLTLIPKTVGRPLKLVWSDLIAAKQWHIENRAIAAMQGTPYNIQISPVLGKAILKLTGELSIDSEPDTFSLAIVDPANYFLETLHQILITEGIIVKHRRIENRQPLSIKHHLKSRMNIAHLQPKVNLQTSSFQNIFIVNQSKQELIYLESEPLSTLVQKTNQDSNNLYAESIVNLLVTQSPPKLENLRSILSQLNLGANNYDLKDGSGLSRHNLATPEIFVETLRLMDKTNEAKTYRDSLAISGISGTLKKRFQNTPVEGILQAKTGTLLGVSALSGYLTPPHYSPLVFSIIINQSPLPASELRAAIDEIVILLSQLKSCE